MPVSAGWGLWWSAMGSETGAGDGGVEVDLKKIDPKMTTAKTASIMIMVDLLTDFPPLADGRNNNSGDGQKNKDGPNRLGQNACVTAYFFCKTGYC